jgi:hypothetical protein
MTNFLKETIPTYLPSYCQGPSVKAKDLTTKSVVKGKGKGREGKGPCCYECGRNYQRIEHKNKVSNP